MSATVVPARSDHGHADADASQARAVNATLASIAKALDPADPRQMDLLRAAADAAHTLHATTARTALRARASDLLRRVHADVVGSDCPLAS